MKTIFKAAMLATATMALPLAIAPTANAQAVKGLGVVNATTAITATTAFKNAQAARPTTYKAQYDQAKAQNTAIVNRLNPMYTKLNADSKKPTPDRKALQTQYAQIQQIEAQGKQQIQQILQPVALSEAYVLEQLSDKFDAALKVAMAAKGTSIVLDMRQTVSHDKGSDLTAAVTAELNRVLPNAVLVPPQGWLPRAQREAAARQAAAQQAAKAAQPAAPQGR